MTTGYKITRERVYNDLKITGGFKIPSYRRQPANRGAGFLYFDTTANEMYVSTANGWVELSTGGGGTDELPPALQSIANLATSGNEMLYTIATNTYNTSPITSTGRTFVAQNSVANQQAVLNLVPGSDVQVQNSLLQSVANQSGVVASDQLFYTTGSTTVQPTSLTSYARNNILTATSANSFGAIVGPIATTNRIVKVSGVDAITESGITIDISDNVTGMQNLSVGGDLTVTGNIDSVTPFQRTQISNMNLTSVSATQWGYLGSLDQALDTSSTPTFNGAAMNSQLITSVANPVNPFDAANKNYVDTIAASGAPPLASVRMATSTILPNTPVYASPAETLTSVGGPGSLTVDGVVALLGDRILVKNQVTNTENGVYVVTDPGSPDWVLTRASDFNQASMPVIAGTSVFVDITVGAVTNPGTTWTLSATVNIVDPLTDPVTFVQTGGSQTFTAGTGINAVSLAGGTIQTELTPRLTITGNAIDLNTVTVPFGGTGRTTLDSNGVLIGDTVNPVNTSKQAPTGDFVGTSDVQTLTNKTITAANNDVVASSLFSNAGGNIVDVRAAANPSIGQVLTATSPTTATWQTVSGFSPSRTLFVFQGAANVSPAWDSVVGAITDAISLIPVASNPVTILIYPGTYTETSSIIVPSHVTLFGVGKPNAVLIQRSTPADNVITMSPASACYYLQVQNATGAGFAGFYYSAAPGNSVARIENCAVRDCAIGFYANGTGAQFSSILVLLNTSVSAVTLITATEGYLADSGGTIDSNNSVASGFFGGILNVGYNCLGAGTLMILNGANANFVNTGYRCVNSSGSGTAELRVEDGALTFIQNIGADLGIRSIMRLTTVSFADDNPSKLDIVGTSLPSPNQSLLIGIGLLLRIDLVQLGTNVQIVGTSLSTVPDEVQLQVLGELVVGFPNRGFESIFGEGDSHSFSMAIYRYTGAGAGTDGTFVDNVTSDLLLVNSTTVSPFATTPGASGDTFYVGGALQPFPGLRIVVDSGVIPAGLAGDVVFEIWTGSWVAVNIMSTDRNSPYLTHAEAVFDAGNYHYLFGDTSGWTQKVLTGDPDAFNAYWMRFRLTNAITTNPEIEQIKLHTNRTEINSDGFLTRYGSARVINTVQIPLPDLGDTSIYNNAVDQALVVSTGPPIIRGIRENSSFGNAGTTGQTFVWAPVPEIDTSYPLRLVIAYSRSTGASGNVRFEVDYAYSEVDGVVGNPNGGASNSTQKQAAVTSAVSATVRGTSNAIIPLPITDFTKNDFLDIWFTLKRLGSDVLDTYNNTIYVHSLKLQYVTWKDGSFLGSI